MLASLLGFSGKALAVDASDPIAGVSSVTAVQLEAELSSVNPYHIHSDIAQLYITWGQVFGIRADLAFSQMLLETGYLRYGGDVQPWQNNFCGLGATGGGNPGNSFPSATAGVIAHYAHLAWYIFPNHVNSYCSSQYDPRHFGSGHLNNVRILADLDGKWAVPGYDYGSHIATIANRIWSRPADYPIVGAIRTKYDSLGGAPGAPLSAEYPVHDYQGAWSGQAQDFVQGRLTWNKDGVDVFWVYGGILAKYDSLGREWSFLGLPLTDEFAAPGGRANDFQGGRIYWGASSGAHEVHGDILARYGALGGPGAFGLPQTDEYDAPGAPGWRESDFQWGRLYWSAPTGTYEVHGAILAKYIQKGASAAMGPPEGDEASIPGVAGGRMSSFSGGDILWSATSGAHSLLPGPIYDYYQSWGGPAGYLGLPTSDRTSGPSGYYQNFQAGIITYCASCGAHSVYGGIYSRYASYLGPFGALGSAISEEYDTPGAPGGRESDFLGGRIYWSASTGAHGVYGGIAACYVSLGGPAALGLPTSEEYSIVGVAGGRESDFQRGSIYWSGSTGAHEVHGAIQGHWYLYGGPQGPLGLPLTDEYATPGVATGRESDFQGGSIYWSDSTGAHLVYGGILGAYLQAGTSASALGLPTSEEHDIPGVPGGRQSDFQGGSVCWTAATGAHAVSGAIQGLWYLYGGPAGPLGLPTSDEYDAPGVPGGRESDFQGGRIYSSPATGTHLVYGGILGAYLQAGGCASSLGLPTSEEYNYGPGRRSDFQGGYITWEAATGAQVTLNG